MHAKIGHHVIQGIMYLLKGLIQMIEFAKTAKMENIQALATPYLAQHLQIVCLEQL